MPRPVLAGLNQGLGGDTTVEIGPHVLREIVQLAATHGVPVIAPGKHFRIQPLVKRGGEARLGFFETIERNSHIHMVGAVLENVMDQTVERPHEFYMHRGRCISRVSGPLVTPLVPGDSGMSVLYIDDETHQAIPKEERHHESEYQQRPNRPAAVDAPHDQAADPKEAEGRHQQAVPGVADASGGYVLASREEELLPPHLDHVVHALTDAAAVNTLQPAPNPRQTRELGGRVGRPNVVTALEIGEPVMREVMADFP